LAFVTEEIVMQDSNLAQRAAPVEDQPAPVTGNKEWDSPAPPKLSRLRPRPRRPFAFRSIVISDQGLRLFRCG
jgi:hypothetical protein